MSTYIPNGNYPAGRPTATIYIDGLLAVCFKGDKKCTVAAHKQSTHTLALQVFKWTPNNPPQPDDCEAVEVNLPDNYQKVEIKVKKLTTSKKEVKVYNGPPHTLPPPTAPPPPWPPDQRLNFIQLCVDLEGGRGHTQRLKNKPSTLWPRFYIDDGLFCAYKESKDQFQLTPKGMASAVTLNTVALAIAADIFLVAGESIEITADGMPLNPPVSLAFGSIYQIGLTNVCKMKPTVDDFELYYEVLDISLLPAPKYNLDNLTGIGDPERTKLGPCLGGSHFSDRVPCMSAVFGQTNDFVD